LSTIYGLFALLEFCLKISSEY